MGNIIKAISLGLFISTTSTIEAQIDRDFWKSEEEIDQFYGKAAADRGAYAQHKSLDSVLKRVSDRGKHSHVENIKYFSESLMKLSRDNIYQLRRRFEVYDKVQQTLLSIPGHASYIADEIKRDQKEVEGIPTMVGKRISYDRKRGWHFLTMRHLPSPETVLVLGGFLSDDIDTPVPLNTPGSDWGENPRANSYFAADTIYNIGLREPPEVTDGSHLYPDDLLAATRLWWQGIKSGQRTFSFKGQAVEYRFNPDGTWQTISIPNPPDDAPEITEARPAATRAVKQRAKEQPPGNAGKAYRPYLLAALAGLIALAAAWFALQRTKAGT